MLPHEEWGLALAKNFQWMLQNIVCGVGDDDCSRTVLMLIVFFASAQTFSFDFFLAIFLYLESFGDLALVLLEFNEMSGPQW